MGIGLCCVSMPALSKMLSYHLPRYEKLKSWMSSRYGSAKSSTANSSVKPPTGLGRLFNPNAGKNSKRHDSYFDLEDNRSTSQSKATPHLGSLPYELSPVKSSVQTLIGTGNRVQVHENQIHLETDVKQNSQSCDGH